MKALPEKDPDTMVTMSATVSEQEDRTRGRMLRCRCDFAMRMRQGQISRAKSTLPMCGRDGRGFGAYQKHKD